MLRNHTKDLMNLQNVTPYVNWLKLPYEIQEIIFKFNRKAKAVFRKRIIDLENKIYLTRPFHDSRIFFITTFPFRLTFTYDIHKNVRTCYYTFDRGEPACFEY
jgi:hypothetical protein